MTAPAFSIIVPAYNAESTIEDTIASTRQQTLQDFELIVVVDGSTDGTAQLAERSLPAGRGRVLQQANRGLPAARNAAIHAARGRWIALLDSDDLMMPAYLERMRALLTGPAAPGLAYCDAWVLDEHRGRISRRSAMEAFRPAEPPGAGPAFFRALLRQNFVYVGAAAPRAVLERMGGFDETLRAAEDWQMWLKIAASGYAVASTTDRLAVYRRRPGQMSADLRAMADGRLAVMATLHRWRDLPSALEPEVRQRERDAEAELASVAAPARLPLPKRARRRLREGRRYYRRPPRVVADAFPNLLSGRPAPT
jgi:glycosyltransferase involved in cell wall biosynthesis